MFSFFLFLLTPMTGEFSLIMSYWFKTIFNIFYCTDSYILLKAHLDRNELLLYKVALNQETSFGTLKKRHYSIRILDQLDDVMRILGQRTHCSARDQFTVVLQGIKRRRNLSKCSKILYLTFSTDLLFLELFLFLPYRVIPHG